MRQSFDVAVEAVETPKVAFVMCGANGCPCMASVNFGNGWLCRFHDGSEADCWRVITDGLRQHEWLIAFVTELQRLYSKGEDRRCREWITSFVELRPEMSPTAAESRHLPKYLHRLQRELRRRVVPTKERAGERLTRAQREKWREALVAE